MLEKFGRIIDLGRKIQTIAGVFLLVAMIIIVSIAVVTRYVFKNPFSWTEELVGFLFIWLSMLGAGVAAANNKHICVNLIESKFSAQGRAYLEFIGYVSVLIFLFFVLTSSIVLYLKICSLDTRSVVLGIPRQWYYMSILVASFYMILVFFYRLLAVVRAIKTGKTDNLAKTGETYISD